MDERNGKAEAASKGAQQLTTMTVTGGRPATAAHGFL